MQQPLGLTALKACKEYKMNEEITDEEIKNDPILELIAQSIIKQILGEYPKS
jgi:hypothetical protein